MAMEPERWEPVKALSIATSTEPGVMGVENESLRRNADLA